MKSQLLKFSLLCVTGAVIIAANPKTAFASAYEEAVAGFTYDKASASSDNSDNATLTTLASDNIPIPGFSNVGIANVDTNLLIRSGPGSDEKILGKLSKNGGCDILEADKGNGWTKVSSGKVKGYVKTEFLVTGTKASKLALEVGDFIATANTDGIRVRKEPNTNSEILDQIAKGEDLIVLDAKVVSYGEEYNKWVKVRLDSDDSANGQEAYVAKEFVNLSYSLKQAVSMDEINLGTGISSVRASLVNAAKQYLGDPYVWGGTRLGHGVDCSGFTQAIYREFGYSIPRVSRDQAKSGSRVSASSLKPGDLIFYGNSSSGYISHVAIYIGNGRIIHASNPRDGIKISNMYYRQPVKCVRFIND